MWITLLKVRATCAPYEDRVTRKCVFVIRRDIRHAAIGVPRGRTHFELQTPCFERATVFDENVRADRPGVCAHHCLASESLPQEARCGDVIGVCMRIHRVDELEPKLIEELDVAFDLIDHWIDQYGLARVLVRDEVGVGPGFVIKELAK